MTPRSLMTMRAFISRDTQIAIDPYGHAGPKQLTLVVSNVPCRVSHGRHGELSITDNRIISYAHLSIIMPIGTNVKAKDSITVKDKLGNILFEKLNVENPRRRFNHLECRVLEIDG